MFINQINL